MNQTQTMPLLIVGPLTATKPAPEKAIQAHIASVVEAVAARNGERTT